MSSLRIVNFDVDIKFLEQFDALIKKKGWESRAEALRHLMREYMEKYKET